MATVSKALLTTLPALTIIFFLGTVLQYIAVSWRWRLMVDSSIVHYVVFLMRHGLKPYAQISDNNMPGAYLVEAAGMSLFGPGDVAWRLFEFSVLAGITFALVRLARRWDPLAGVFAAGTFIALHAAEGPQYAAERELSLSLLLLLAYVILFSAVEDRRFALMLPFGLCCGLAASIKPTFLPLPLAVLALALLVLRSRGSGTLPAAAYAIGGMAIVALCDLAFLIHEHALGAFAFILTAVLPAYAGGYGTTSRLTLLAHPLPKLAMPFLVPLILLGIANRRRHGPWGWMRWALCLGALGGLLSFVLQGKGFLHHRYTFLLFLLLLVGIEIFQGLKSNGWPRYVAAATLLFAFAVVLPRSLMTSRHAVGHSDLELAIEQDLQTLGTTHSLQGEVQCFDLVYGCLDALYHQHLVENSGFTGDLLFFSERPTVATEYYRERFWRGAASDPAGIIILSNQDLGRRNDFAKLQRWPAFNNWLKANYSPVLERHFTFEHFGGRFVEPVKSSEQDGYRIYIRKDSPLLSASAPLQASRRSGQSN